MPAANTTSSASRSGRCSSIGEAQAGDPAVGVVRTSAAAAPVSTCEAERLDVPAQRAAAALVELDGHEAGGELDDVRVDAEQAQGVGRLQPEQPPPTTAPVAHPAAHGSDGLEVVDACGRRSSRPRRCPAMGGTNGDEPVASTQAP